MKILAICAGVLSFLFINACDWDFEVSDQKSFDYNLRGTWVSNDTYEYSGTLIIDYDRITIIGYNGQQTSFWGNDEQRPFKNFLKEIPLKGYSEDGKLFIEDGGLIQEGIPYTYWEDNPPGYGKLKFLRFTFADRVETLQYQ